MVPFRSHLAEVGRASSLPGKFARATRDQTLKVLSVLALFSMFSGPITSCVAIDTALLSGWVSAQTNLQSWSADVTQTRSLITLTQPQTARGRVWFAAPHLFRWEILTPAQTIAVRQPDQMLVIYPQLKRAERYPLSGDQSEPWKDTLSLLEAGFPRSQADLEARFKILSQSVSNQVCELALQPRSASARRMMPLIKITFATNDFSLRATELQFADGSTMRNDFSNAKLNPKLEDGLFTPKLENDFKIVEPMMK